MMFKDETKLYAYEVKREAGQDVIYVNYMGAAGVPDLADSAMIMSRAIDYLIEVPRLLRLFLSNRETTVILMVRLNCCLRLRRCMKN